MKRYKLLKDLPTFNAGDEFVLRDNGCLYLNKVDAVGGYLTGVGHWKNDVMAYHKRTLEQFPNILEDWFEEIKDGGGWKPNQGEKYWYIDHEGEILAGAEDGFDDIDAMVTIGDCFKTRKEAEEAVEKLKAWQRLKDKGLRFDGYDVAHNSNGDLCGQVFYNAGKYSIEDIEHELDLLFSGEDD